MSYPTAVSTSDTPRPNKRLRPSDEIPGLSRAKRSPKYWFEDGNIVLHVDDTLFCVHRGVLSRHSAVFRDMFSLPQPAPSESGGETVIEGCAVVDLPGDKSEDWENVFQVIYDFDVGYKKTGEFPYKRLISMLRLGRKYQFDAIFNEAFAQIAALVPTKLKLDGQMMCPDEFMGENLVLFRLLSVMLEIGNQSLLPMLFFFIVSSFEIDRIFALGKEISLDPEVVENIIVGGHKIELTSLKYHLDFTLPPNQTDAKRKICGGTCQYFIIGLLRLNWHLDIQQLLFTGRFYVDDAEALEGELCEGCSEAACEAQNANRTVLWAQIPSFFGLPDWKDLKDL